MKSGRKQPVPFIANNRKQKTPQILKLLQTTSVVKIILLYIVQAVGIIWNFCTRTAINHKYFASCFSSNFLEVFAAQQLEVNQACKEAQGRKSWCDLQNALIVNSSTKFLQLTGFHSKAWFCFLSSQHPLVGWSGCSFYCCVLRRTLMVKVNTQSMAPYWIFIVIKKGDFIILQIIKQPC